MMPSTFILLLPSIFLFVDSSLGIPVGGLPQHHYRQYNEADSIRLVIYQLYWFRAILGILISGLLIISYSTTSWQVKKYCTIGASSLSLLQLIYAVYEPY